MIALNFIYSLVCTNSFRLFLKHKGTQRKLAGGNVDNSQFIVNGFLRSGISKALDGDDDDTCTR